MTRVPVRRGGQQNTHEQKREKTTVCLSGRVESRESCLVVMCGCSHTMAARCSHSINSYRTGIVTQAKKDFASSDPHSA